MSLIDPFGLVQHQKNVGDSLIAQEKAKQDKLRAEQDQERTRGRMAESAKNRQQMSDKDRRIKELEDIVAYAQKSLKESKELVSDWQSAMEAWKDLAITLREEIKACPNHEAHKFGKDKDARVEHFNKKETEERVKRNLKPKQYH